MQDVFEYRWEAIMRSSKYALNILLMALVWMAVGQAGGQLGMSTKELTIYYIAAALLYSFSNFHLSYVESDIRLGYISKYLLKPLSAHSFYFFKQWSDALFEFIFKSAVFLPIALRLGWTITPWRLGLFLLFLPVIFYTAFTIFFCLSILTFWLSRSDSIRMSVMFLGRFLSGLFIPIAFLPPGLAERLRWLPFPHYAATPIQLLLDTISPLAALESLVILLNWALVFSVLRKYLWHKAVHAYESTGL
jgi:ABC-2 type transport system permease protein